MNPVLLIFITQFPAYCFALIASSFVVNRLDRFHKMILYNLLLNFAVVIAGVVVQLIGYKNNQWLFNLYIVCETAMLLYAGALVLNMKSAKVLTVSAFAVFISVWIRSVFLHQISNFATIAFVVECVSLVVLYLTILIRLNLSTEKSIYKNPVFWVCCAHVICFSCAVPYFGLFKFLEQYYDLNKNLFRALIVTLQSVRFLFVGIAFLVLRKQPQINTIPL